MHVIKLNGRFYSHRPTGMQRYALELVSRIGDRLEVLRPKHALRGGLGHLWEQIYLPVATGRGLLWSPNNTGPISVARQVCTVHDLIPLDHPEWFNPRFVALYRWLMPRLMARLQHIVAISEFTKLRLLHLFDIDPLKITVIPNGVDKTFRPAPPDRIRQVKESLKLGDKPYVLCVSSFEPRKNLKGLLAAWAALPSSVRNEFQLVLTGARGSGKVFGDAAIGEPPSGTIFTGYVAQEDLPALYSGAEIFAYPSLYEGFGLPPLEAMGPGVLFTLKTSSIPEVVADAGVLVDPADIDSIQEGLYRLMTNEPLRRELSERGLNRAQSASWDPLADQTWPFYNARRQRMKAESPMRILYLITRAEMGGSQTHLLELLKVFETNFKPALPPVRKALSPRPRATWAWKPSFAQSRSAAQATQGRQCPERRDSAASALQTQPDSLPYLEGRHSRQSCRARRGRARGVHSAYLVLC